MPLRCDIFELRFGGLPLDHKAILNSKAKISCVFDVQWMPNNSSRACHVCQETFGTFRKRRHHCRLCGKLVCNPCSQTRSFIHKHTTSNKLERTCLNCSSTLHELVDLGDSRVKLAATSPTHAIKSKGSTSHTKTLTMALPKYDTHDNYIISAQWYHHFQQDRGSAGPISNNTLVYFFKGELHRKLTMTSLDYIIVTKSEWLELWNIYGGGPCITSAHSRSQWNVQFTPRGRRLQECSSFTETTMSLSEPPPSTSSHKHHDNALHKAREAANAFATAASLARREAETMALRKSIASLSDFEDIRLSRQSLSTRYSVY